MNRGIHSLLAAVLCVSSCGGTHKAVVKENPTPPPGYGAEPTGNAVAAKPTITPEEEAKLQAELEAELKADLEAKPEQEPKPEPEPEKTKPLKSIPIPEYLFNQRRYAQALSTFLQENLRTGTIPDPELKFRYQRLGELLARLGFSDVPSREEELRKKSPAADLADKSIRAFLGERERQAVLFAASAQGSDPGNPVYRQILQALEAWTGRAAEAGERQTPDRVAAYKLRRATVLFEAKRYEDAAEHCREGLLLAPRDPALHERLGSMYYAMGWHTRAIESWRESLRLKPSNAPLKDFMARLESDGPKARTP